MAKDKLDQGPRSFARFLENIGDGDFHRDASDGLFELGKSIRDQAIRTEGKVKGKLVLTFELAADARGVVGVSADITVKKPKRKRAAAQAWLNQAGNVVFEHPRQTSLPLREVGGRDVADEGAEETRAVKEI